jgi:Flp pilus assembly protein TadG
VKGAWWRREAANRGRSMKRGINMQKLFRWVCQEDGSQLVEFALTAWVLLVLLFGCFEWMLAMYSYHFATYAAQQGSRFAMVRGNTWSKNTATNCSTSAPPSFTMPYNCTASSSDIQNYIQSLATAGISTTNLTINTTSSYVWPGKTPDNTTTPCTTHANSAGCLVKVTVTYNFNFFPIMKLSTLPISATSEKVILQ